MNYITFSEKENCDESTQSVLGDSRFRVRAFGYDQAA